MLMQPNSTAVNVCLTARINFGTSQLPQMLWRQKGLKRFLCWHARLGLFRKVRCFPCLANLAEAAWRRLRAVQGLRLPGPAGLAHAASLAACFPQFQGSSSCSRDAGCPAIRRKTSASQARGSTSFSLAVMIKEVHGRGAVAAAVGPAEQPRLAPKGHPGVILPISGKRSSSTTGGTRFTGAGCAATMASAVRVATWFMSRWRPASSRWSRPGCWILLPVPAWRLARPALQLLRWLTCIAC